MVLQDKHCEKCGKKYTNEYKWCKQCQINDLKITNQISGNEQIDNLIQEMQPNIHFYDDIVFEWIPYSQFFNIKKISEGGFATVYSAIWNNKEQSVDKKVALKCLHNSQNISDEFLNEVCKFFYEFNFKYIIIY